MRSPGPIYVTGRETDELVTRYGFDGRDEFAADLPKGARVIDVGAGTSPLGRDMCWLRPDIRWFNVDSAYAINTLWNSVTNDAPSNLSHRAFDIFSLDEHLPRQSFDRVFSYALMPHLFKMEATDAPIRAAEQLVRLVHPIGKIAVGPQRREPRHMASFGRAEVTPPVEAIGSLETDSQRATAAYLIVKRSARFK